MMNSRARPWASYAGGRDTLTTTTPRPAGKPGIKEERMSTQKRNNKYDGMNKAQVITTILEDVKSFFGPQDERFAEAMYKELVANGTIKEEK